VKNDRFSKPCLIAYGVGLILVIWAAVLAAPYLGNGLLGLIANIGLAFENPFVIQWCDDTPRIILLFCMIYIVVLGILLADEKNYRRREEYGSAKWGSVALLNQKYADIRKDHLFENKILTQNLSISFQVFVHRRNLNILVIGGSGAGKTRFYVLINLLNANCSFIILDPKGEILRSTGEFLKSQGYEIKVLNLIHMDKSHCYNPYAYIRDVSDIQKLATIIFEAATPPGAQSSEPFWNDSASIVLKALICLQYFEAPVEEQNFDTLMEMLRSAEVKEEDENYQSPLDILFERLRDQDPDHIAVKFYDDFKIAAGKTAKSILITLLSKLEKFNIPELAQLTMTDEMDLESIGNRKTAVFAIIPDSDSSFNFLVSMLYEQIFQRLFDIADSNPTGRLPVHVHFLMDEFANVALPKDFEKKLATMRSREISVSVILQSLSQLKALYEKQWESIVGNCDTMLYLGGNDQFTHKYISETLGKETIDTNTYGKSSGRNGNYSTNFQLAGRELKAPDEVRKLKNDKAIVFIRGEDPVIDQKYDLKKHPNFCFTPEGGGKAFNFDEDTRSFASIALDQRLIEQAQAFEIDYEGFVLLSEEELEESFTKKEKPNHETVQEPRKIPRRKAPRPQ